jgi:DNA primase
LLFQKLRTPDKQFFYRHRENGRWVSGRGVSQPVLYRYPELSGRAFVLVVEGEKDVDAAWVHDLPATTNPEGAGNGKWKCQYTRQLISRGVRRVYAIPDNDDVGRLHAQQVVARCQEAGLHAWLVPLPGVPPHGDLSDYFAAGHTRADVLRLIKHSRSREEAR